MEPAPYDERLGVPLRWWVQGVMLVATLWLALVVALPGAFAWVCTGIALALLAALLVSYGSPHVTVRDGWFRAGRTTWRHSSTSTRFRTIAHRPVWASKPRRCCAIWLGGSTPTQFFAGSPSQPTSRYMTPTPISPMQRAKPTKR